MFPNSMTDKQQAAQGHSHSHAHGHGHSHAHGAGGGHGHGPGHSHGDDHWDGDKYLAMPGMEESAALNAQNITTALQRSGVDPATFPTLNVLEVGCGPGVVTKHLARTFGSVHSIDTSAKMLGTFAARFSPPHNETDNVTWAQHALGPGSGDAFMRGTPQPSPTPSEPARMQAPPRERFDVAVAVLVVHHVDDLEAFFKGVLSVLAPGGKVVVVEFTTRADGRDMISEHFEKQVKEKAEAEGKEVPKDTVNAPGLHHSPFSVELLGALLNHYGFQDVGGDRTSGGGLPVWGPDKDLVPTIAVYGSKPK